MPKGVLAAATLAIAASTALLPSATASSASPKDWSGSWALARTEVKPGTSPDFQLTQSGDTLSGWMPWRGCTVRNLFGYVAGDHAVLLVQMSNHALVTADIALLKSGDVISGTYHVAVGACAPRAGALHAIRLDTSSAAGPPLAKFGGTG